MRIAVLSQPAAWHFQDLVRAADPTHEIVACCFADLATFISNSDSHINSRAVNLDGFDCVIVRAMPSGTLGQVVFRMDVLQQLVHHGVCVLNSPKTIEASVDKYLSLALMKNRGIPIPPTGVCQSSDEAMELFDRLGGDVVVKPIFGSQGRGLERISKTNDAVVRFEQLESEGQVIYLQTFVDHGCSDLRLLVIGDEVFSISRHQADHWITNVCCGATARKHKATEYERHLAIESAAAVNGRVVGVDLLYDRAGQPFVVDVNSAPGWQAVSKTLGVDIAAEVLRVAVEDAKQCVS